MKNITVVIDLLVGRKSPVRITPQSPCEIERTTFAEILKHLHAEKTTYDKISAVGNEIMELLKHERPLYVSSAVAALLIAYPESWAASFREFEIRLVNIPEQSRDRYIFYQGVVVGCAEALNELGEDPSFPDRVTAEIFLSNYLEFVTNHFMTTWSNYAEEVVGRFSNVSGRIIRLPGIETFFRKARTKNLHPLSEFVISELCKRRFKSASLTDQLVFCAQPTKTNISTDQKVLWRKLTSKDVLRPGDMWASCDPNTPELQSGNSNYHLQMAAVDMTFFDMPPGTNLGNGWHWRPVGIVPV